MRLPSAGLSVGRKDGNDRVLAVTQPWQRDVGTAGRRSDNVNADLISAAVVLRHAEWLIQTLIGECGEAGWSGADHGASGARAAGPSASLRS